MFLTVHIFQTEICKFKLKTIYHFDPQIHPHKRTVLRIVDGVIKYIGYIFGVLCINIVLVITLSKSKVEIVGS